MTVNYSDLQKTATDLITKFGQSVTFNRYTETYQISSATTVTYSTYTGIVVLVNKPVRESQGNAQEETTHDGLVSSTTAVEVGDIADINSESMRVLAVNKIQPAGTSIYYEVQFAS